MPPPTPKSPAPKPPREDPQTPLDLYAEPGDVVLWSHGTEPDPAAATPAVVTRREMDNAISCATLQPDIGFGVPREGVPHATDPRRGRDPDAGIWWHRPWTLALRRLMLAWGALRWDGRLGAYTDVADPPAPPAPPPPPAAPRT